MRKPTNLLIVFAGVAVWFSEPSRASEAEFSQEGNRLTIRSSAVELTFQDGAVILLKNRHTGEVFGGDPAAELWQQIPRGSSSQDDWNTFHAHWRQSPERYAQDEKIQRARRRPGGDRRCEFQRVGPLEGEMLYTKLPGGDPADELRYRFRIDEPTGEIVLRASARHADPQTRPITLDVPLLGLCTPAVILGNGARYVRDDPAEVDFCYRWANNLCSPRSAVIEGQRSCLAVWNEEPLAAANLFLAHRASSDQIVLHAQRDPLEKDPEAIRLATWRIGAFADWVQAARRYRQLFSQATGAKPLWENACPWVRQIHAVCTQLPQPADAEAFYEKLAQIIDPAKLLLFYWNGSGIILFGDHRYMARLGTPKPEAIQSLKKHGFRWMGYHPYTLLYSPQGTKQRLAECAARGDLPEGYAFQPDYAGPRENFHEYFRPVSCGYYHPLDEAELWVIHPGSRIGREYLVHNFAAYCRFHGMDGAYMDILGGDHGYMFPPEKRVLDGATYPMGEGSFLNEVHQRHPELAVMSEIQSEWTVAGTFYTWEGASHFHLPRHHPSIRTKVNHPLRTALWGSYTWTRDDELDPAESALIGALPPLVMEDDWSIARAKLFAEKELYNDLPERWDPAVLAYYRGKDGQWVEYRKTDFGECFAEQSASGPRIRLGRFYGVARSTLNIPARIQDWPAYQEGQPIGLDPDRAYPFMVEPPKPEEHFWITSLPEGAFVRAVRHGKQHSVIELGDLSMPDEQGRSRTVGVTVRFHQRCLRVCDAEKEIAGPFEPGMTKTMSTPLPGGLVFVWEEPAAGEGRFRSDMVGDSGKLLARGTPDRAWCYNSAVQQVNASVSGREYPSVSLGSGRHRTYADKWIHLASGAQPVLKFDLGYVAPAERHRPSPRPLLASVAVNGCRVWSEEVKAESQWRPREVPLAAYAGRKVLITLSVEATDKRPIDPQPGDPPVLFGRVRVDHNPGPLDPPDATALSKPAHILFADGFAGPELDKAWRVYLSPAHASGSRLFADHGRLCIESEHYKYAYLARPLSHATLSVQARIQTRRTGCELGWNPGIGLYWDKGKYCFVTGGAYRGDDERLVIRGYGARQIPLGPRRMPVGDDNCLDFRVKIELTAEAINYSVSLDGHSWEVETTVPRPQEISGPPQWLIVGRGGEGPAECFQNDERWPTGVVRSYVSELLVGQSGS